MTNPGVGMPCPVCAVPLVMSDRQGVEIDYCPQCRGVWLDRGELDKIIERSAAAESASRPASPPQYVAPPASEPHPESRPWGNEHRSYRPDDRRGYPKRKKSFLEDLFD